MKRILQILVLTNVNCDKHHLFRDETLKSVVKYDIIDWIIIAKLML